MMDFFSKFGSCYRLPRRRQQATDGSFLCHIRTAGDCRRPRGNRVFCHRNRPSHWRPALSVIMEDSLDQEQDHDHDNNLKRKSDKSPGKNKSVADVARISSRCRDKESPKPKIYISPFSGAMAYMF